LTKPPPGAIIVPPGGVPPGPVVPPPADLPGPGASIKPPPGPLRVDFRWTPAPETKTTSKGPAPVLLLPPEVTEEPSAEPKTAPKKTTLLPVGIPGFAAGRDKVATGMRPSLDEGLDWLAANNYRTVLHVRLAEPDGADKKQVEKRGMKYVALEINPAELTRDQVDEFIRIVKDAAGQPLFVYDRDGSLAGGLWYLYYRMAEELPDDVARIRAGSVGLRESGEMWEAVRKLAP
jgi:hypothetical protein